MNKMNKILVFVTAALTAFSFTPISFAGNSDTVTASLAINSYVSVDCTKATINMNDIAGTGQSSLDAANNTTCTVKTNAETGYSLTWTASAATMSGGGGTIASYTETTPGTPENWTLTNNTDSEWGGHLGSASTTVNTTTWGAADTYAAGKWMKVDTTADEIAARTSETSAAGDSEIVWFGAEIGSAKSQIPSSYTVTVTITGTAS